jgi:Beta-lactamase superfamily domain
MSLEISRILHAGYLFEFGGQKIAFDPIFENPFSRNCYAFPKVQFDHEKIRALRLDAVFISHFHDDHCSLKSLDLLDKETPIYLFCVFPELAEMIKKLGFAHVRQLTLTTPVIVGPFEVLPLAALDVDVDSIFHVKVGGLNILNVVDSWIGPTVMNVLAQTAPWDMVLWPFQTMRELEVLSPRRAEPATGDLPLEWCEQLKILNPRCLVPSSCQFIHENWSWYNNALFPISYERFQDKIAEILPDTRVLRVNPSASIKFGQDSIENGLPLNWVQPLEAQNVDYQYIPDLKPPSTSEISMRFPSLTKKQTDWVFHFCRDELPTKYNVLEFHEESYFQETKIWQLSLHDHQGGRTDFYYQIKKGVMELTSSAAGPTGWLTEIAIFKLHSALTSGESLTSLYMRINDIAFTESTENEIRLADIMEDPLIRCLFNEDFGAYQRHQLTQLR